MILEFNHQHDYHSNHHNQHHHVHIQLESLPPHHLFQLSCLFLVFGGVHLHQLRLLLQNAEVSILDQSVGSLLDFVLELVDFLVGFEKFVNFLRVLKFLHQILNFFNKLFLLIFVLFFVFLIFKIFVFCKIYKSFVVKIFNAIQKIISQSFRIIKIHQHQKNTSPLFFWK